MKSIIYLLVIGVIIWVGYATFFGNPEERAMRDRLFEGVKSTGQVVGDIVKSQKSKFDAGQYNTAIDQVTKVLTSLKKESKESGVENSQIADLEKKKKELESMLATYNKSEDAKASGTQARTTSDTPHIPSPAELNAKLQDITNVLSGIEKGLGN